MKKDIIFFEGPTADIYYDEELNVIILEYKDAVGVHPNFVKVNEKVLESFKTLKTNKFVADIRKMGVISPESQDWVSTVLIPGMISHLNGDTLYHAQLLDNLDIFATVGGSGVKQRTERSIPGFSLKQFSDINALTNWLKEVS